MKHVGYGEGYRYVHNDPDAKEMECLPSQLSGHRYFTAEDEEQQKKRTNEG
jgi:putative ATPase